MFLSFANLRKDFGPASFGSVLLDSVIIGAIETCGDAILAVLSTFVDGNAFYFPSMTLNRQFCVRSKQ
jgi:hypothetical protein